MRVSGVLALKPKSAILIPLVFVHGGFLRTQRSAIVLQGFAHDKHGVVHLKACSCSPAWGVSVVIL